MSSQDELVHKDESFVNDTELDQEQERHPNGNTNWYQELIQLKNVEGITVHGCLYLTVEEAKKSLNYWFDSGYGCAHGPAFTLWTRDKVYFPVQYDGSEWISSIPRHPGTDYVGHQGGG